jgi:hypothetical protein
VIIIFNGFNVFVGEHHQNWNITGTSLSPLQHLLSQR